MKLCCVYAINIKIRLLSIILGLCFHKTLIFVPSSDIFRKVQAIVSYTDKNLLPSVKFHALRHTKALIFCTLQDVDDKY